jgi:hypothetical protein
MPARYAEKRRWSLAMSLREASPLTRWLTGLSGEGVVCFQCIISRRGSEPRRGRREAFVDFLLIHRKLVRSNKLRESLKIYYLRPEM